MDGYFDMVIWLKVLQWEYVGMAIDDGYSLFQWIVDAYHLVISYSLLLKMNHRNCELSETTW